MLSPLRNRFGIPGVISVIALVFAMLGGAYAASNNSGAKATASSKGKPGPRGPRGKTGPAGPAGPTGPAGPQGAAGAAGKDGANGLDGEDGKAGKNGTNGKDGEDGEDGVQGPAGPEGSPWTELGTLPSGETETGTWAFGAVPKGAEPNAPFDFLYTPISFTIPLATELEEGEVHLVSAAAQANEEVPAECTVEGTEGSAANPKAAPGNLCVYVGARSGEETFVGPFVANAGASAQGAFGAARSGASVIALSWKQGAYAFGTWAVTAP